MRCEYIDPYRRIARIVVFERRIDTDAEFCQGITHEFLHIATSATIELKDMLNDLFPNHEVLLENSEVNCSEKIVAALMVALRYGLGDELTQWFRDDSITLDVLPTQTP